MGGINDCDLLACMCGMGWDGIYFLVLSRLTFLIVSTPLIQMSPLYFIPFTLPQQFRGGIIPYFTLGRTICLLIILLLFCMLLLCHGTMLTISNFHFSFYMTHSRRMQS